MVEIIYNEQLPLYHFRKLQQYASIKHYVSGRKGGVSQGEFDSLNISFSTADNTQNVQENRWRIARALAIDDTSLIFARQTHEDDVLEIGKTFLNKNQEGRQEDLLGKDALICCVKGQCIVVTAADCVPILFYDPIQQAIGAAHAGWRGTAKQMAMKTLKAMQIAFESKPSDILVGIGPSISGLVYEVGQEVLDGVGASVNSMDGLVKNYNPHTGKGLLDLWETNKRQLLEAGILLENIEVAGICTYTQHDLFFSARRFAGKGGRFSAGIMLC